MELATRIAADGILAIIAIVGAVALLRGIPNNRINHTYPYAIMAGLTALLIGKLMSLLYQPAVARPFLEQGVAPGAFYIDNPGFPSDHALLAGVIVLAISAITPYKKLALMLAMLAIIMGIARVLALVHTPVDVIGGFVAALVGGLWYFAHAKFPR